MANYLLIKNVEEALQKGDTKSASDLLSDADNTTEVKNNSWDLVPIIAKYLSSEHEKSNESVFKCCESLLVLIAQQSNPEETVLQFIDEIEETEDDVKLKTLLTPLKQVLSRISLKKIHSLAWCFNAIQTFVNKCEVPDYNNFTGKEKLLVDTYESYQRITAIYKELVPFYNYFVQNLLNESNSALEVKAVVCKFLIQLLGKPLGYLDTDVFDNIKGKSRILAEELVTKILLLNKDPFQYLKSEEINEITTPHTLGISVLFYMIFSEHTGIENIPKVYRGEYIFQYTLHLLYTLFDEGNQMTIEKGLKLAHSVLIYVKGKKLCYAFLDHEDHKLFCKSLSGVIIYNSVETYRKDALSIFKSYLQCFDNHGSYLLIYNLMSTIEHNGLKSYLVSFYKEMVVREFLQTEHISIYFKGPKLLSMLKKFCILPQKEESDLVENSDQIIATLNLLRFLILKDKENHTGIWNYLDYLEDIYFKPLRKGIELSKAHYELKTKQIKGEKVDEGNWPDVSVSVKGLNLTQMPKDEKLKVLCSSITALDVIDSLLSRLIECIEVKNDAYNNAAWAVCRLHSSQAPDKKNPEDKQCDNSDPSKEYEDNIKNKILAASLPFVPKLGWSKDALCAGAEAVGYPGVTHGLFTRGGADLVHYFNTSSNAKLVEILKNLQKVQDISPPAEFCEKAIRERLLLVVPYLDKWPQAIAIMSLPPNVPNALATLLAMVDDICYYAGDRSVDFNWYIRRVGIAGVYKATELYLIQDRSPEHRDTWNFLKRRMEEAVQLHDIINKSDLASQGAKDTIQSAFVTARNILGLNWNR